MTSPIQASLLSKAIFLFLLFTAVLLPGQFLDNRIALASARPSGAGKQPVLANYGSKTGLALNAQFPQDSNQRACWDFALRTSLVHASGVRMRILVQNPQAASQYNFYIKAGSTWYSVIFSPSKDNAWEDIFIPKTSFTPEGMPQSWSDCPAFRIAAWKGDGGKLAIHLAELEFTRPNANIAILKSGTKANPNEAKEAAKYAKLLNDALILQGLRPAIIEDDDCLETHLKPYDFAFVPYPKASSPQQLLAISNMIRRGTKLGVFHDLPSIISAHLQMPNANFIRASSLPNPLGGVVPELGRFDGVKPFIQASSAFMSIPKVAPPLVVSAWWYDALGRKTNLPAVVETSNGFWMTHVYLNQDPWRGADFLLAQTARFFPNLLKIASQTKLNTVQQAYANATSTEQQAAREALQAAVNLHSTAQYKPAIEYAHKALGLLANATTTMVPAKPNEIRAAWSISPTGPPGQAWAQTCARLRSAGFNAVFPLVATPYSAAYKSAIHPRSQIDTALGDCLQAAVSNGIQVHAWINCLNIQDAPQGVKDKFNAENRLQLDSNGKTLYWLCPSLLANHTLITKTIGEVASHNGISGIHLDLIRFASSQSCLCHNCRKSFELFMKTRVASWPSDVLVAGNLRNEWLRFRQLLITSLVENCSTAARSKKPGIIVSAAVYPELENAKSTVAQAWTQWIARGYVNYLCTMTYQSTTPLFKADIQRQARQLGSPSSIIPGIGVSTNKLPLDEVKRQINATRENKNPGFILFQLGIQETNTIIPNLANF
ncbi:MAG: family 10 glycosylhydrolase [Lentisphaerae bacterium]|jgi:uncharacterized lipoprotein YddW (UPF0748 family)|nr:family 10 glycosylhydrolase [Lentisphaerota bacterium]